MFPESLPQRMKLLSSVFDIIIIAAIWNLEQTPHSLCRWVYSIEPNNISTPMRPFQKPQGLATEQKYISQWKQFLFHCFRVAELKPAMRKEQYGVVFTKDQLKCLKEVNALMDEVFAEGREKEWDTYVAPEMGKDDPLADKDEDEEFDDADEGNDPDVPSPRRQSHIPRPIEVRPPLSQHQSNTPGGTSTHPLTGKLFELCIRFLTQPIQTYADEAHAPLPNFCAVLGIDWKAGRFREPGNYTPIMAALLWIGRLLLLEYVLPGKEYPTLGWPK
jgi:hypothetical protein